MKKGTKYKFSIWNFTKPKSLFKDGMKPVWLSKKRMQKMKVEKDDDAWEFIPKENIGDSIRYYRSSIVRSREKKGLFDKLFAEDDRLRDEEDKPSQ